MESEDLEWESGSGDTVHYMAVWNDDDPPTWHRNEDGTLYYGQAPIMVFKGPGGGILALDDEGKWVSMPADGDITVHWDGSGIFKL